MITPRRIEAPVKRVTVLEDRARIRRTARLELAPGVHCLTVDQVTPLVIDRTLGASTGGPLQLRQVRICREATVHASRPDQERELGQEIDRLKQSFLEEHDAQRVAEAELRLLERSHSDWLQACSFESGRGMPGRLQTWRSGLERLEQRLEVVGEQIRRSREAADDLAERLEQAGERQFLAMQPTAHYWGRLEAVVEAGGGPCELHLDYLVACALWRPVHRAELAGERVQWTLAGMVWQRTGEDWDGVELALSTARPTAGAKVPLLEEDKLRIRQKTEAEQASVPVESRDDAIAALAPQAGDGAGLQVPGVADGGEVRRFEPPSPARIPSDGRAHLVELDSFSSPVTLDRVCYPELGGQVVLRSRQTNSSAHPLLAGPVTLLRDGGFSGRSLVNFAGPGEPFEIGWGTLDSVQVVRRLDQMQEDLSLGRGVRRREHVQIFLSNTGRETQRVKVLERVPVSEVSEVRVKIIEAETTAGARPDEQGHLQWELELPPDSHRELSLVYEIESAKRVVWTGTSSSPR